MWKYFKYFKQSSIYKSFLISYLLVLIIPLAIGSMDYIRYTNIIKNETENYNLTMLRQAGNVIDERLGSVEQMALDISSSQIVQNFISVHKDMDYNDRLLTIDLVQAISKFKSMNVSVSDIYIYFNNSDLIVTDSAKHDPKQYYQQKYSNTELSYDDWRAALTADRYKEYRVTYFKDDSAGINKSATLFKSLKIGTGNAIQGTLAINIKNERIARILEEVSIADKGTVYVVNSRNEIVTSVGDSELIIPARYEDLRSEDKFTYTTAGGSHVIVSHVLSQMNDWLYVSVVPMDFFMEKISSIRNTTLVVIFIGLMVGVVLALLLSKKNSTPILRLVDRIKTNIETKDFISDLKNEIDYIERATMTMITEGKNIKTAMENQMPALRAGLMVQLIKGNISEDINLEHTLDSVGIRFQHPYFCVLVIDIEGCRDESMKKEAGLIKFIITNIALELGNEKNIAFVLDLEWDRIVMLLNLHDIENGPGEVLDNIAVRMQTIVSEKFSIDISIGIGEFCQQIEKIKESYVQAVKALEYKIFSGTKCIKQFKDIGAGSQNYIYSVEMEMQLIKSVKFGDFDTVHGLLEDIFRQIFAEKNLSLEIARCYYFDIMNTGIKVLSSINIEYEQLFGKEAHPINQLISCSTINQMHAALESIFMKICEYIGNIKLNPANEEIIEHVVKYIENKYPDPNVSLAVVALEFDISPSNLSHLFKDNTGQNFSDYLRQKRIERVQELLRESSMPLEQIARAVGYVNSNVLIRNFKKVESVTPGQYRENHLKIKSIADN